MNFDSADFGFEPGQPPVSIIEVGVNHNGSTGIARRLVDKAKSAGASVVKFQAFVAEEEISRFAEKAEYQKQTTGAHEGQLEMARKLELTHDQLRELRQYCRDAGMPFLCSVFDDLSLRFLVQDLQLKALKIPSSEVTNHPFLAEISRLGLGMILSTGASSHDEVAAAMKAIRDAGKPEIVLLHCVSNYPAEADQVNLGAMRTLAEAFQVPVGFSDHTEGVEIPIIATAMGAVAIEKHFTLDKTMEGPDHRASIDPGELERMVRGMAMAYRARGNGRKEVAACEMANRALIRKSIVSRAQLRAGHVLTAADLGYKRPYVALHPFENGKVIGRRLKRDLAPDEPIALRDLE